ncbi:MAG: NUDIX domain-containing protein [Bacilli bacterium]|nr:NUDIX domain-containing protein [Bacilli bacterium]
MEYLDVYDEFKNYLGKELRDVVHNKGLWHNTVHCWLYDNKGNIYFQIRADSNLLYTTASGHVNAGETIKQAFGREIKEEIGIEVDFEEAILVDIFIWKMDKIKKDNTKFIDRAFSNVYICEYNGNDQFDFDLNEVKGIVKVNAKETLSLFENKVENIESTYITNENTINKKININNFLITENETALTKYGLILKKIIETVI